MTDDAFDALMASTDAAMAVVTTAAGDEAAGCLVGFHCQASIDPPRYAVLLSKANRTYRVALRGTHLGIHMLTAGDHDLAARFGEETGDEVDKFAGLATGRGAGGVPLLDSCPHRLVVRRTVVVDDGGDHACFMGEVVAAGTTGRFDPLRLAGVGDLTAGHAAEEAPPPPGGS